MPSIRQRFHLSPCSDFRSHFSVEAAGVAIEGVVATVLGGNLVVTLSVVAIVAVVLAVLLSLPEIRAWLDPNIRTVRRGEEVAKKAKESLAAGEVRKTRSIWPWDFVEYEAKAGIVTANFKGLPSRTLRIRRFIERLAHVNLVPYRFLSWLYERPGCQGIAAWLADNCRIIPMPLAIRFDKWLVSKGSWVRPIGKRK